MGNSCDAAAEEEKGGMVEGGEGRRQVRLISKKEDRLGEEICVVACWMR
jgi:hypothetical protein